ncbi:MAG TPA: ABC transporter permease [Nocardioidaceae bacterium]
MTVGTRPAAPAAGDGPLLPLVNPGRVGGLRDVFRRRYLLKLLVRKELKVRYAGSSVGLAWSYVKPAVRFAMYYWVIGLLLGNRLENRALHIFAGMVLVSFTTATLNAGCKSVVKNGSLIKKINMPREMFPVASVLVSGYYMIPMYVILLLGCMIAGWHPDLGALLAAVMALALVLIWGLGIALFLSAWNVFFRDTANVVDVLQTLVTWTVPMIYPFAIVMDKLQGRHELIYQLYLANPLCVGVLLNNRAFWIPASDDPAALAAMDLPEHLYERGAIAILAGLVFVWVGQTVFSRFETKFAEKL